MAQIYFTRAKLFQHEVDGAVRRFTAVPSAGRPVQAPDWVRDTPTFKLGIKDGSITDLTPAAPVAETAVAVAPEASSEAAATSDGAETDAAGGKKKGGKKDPGAAMGLSA